MENLTNLRQQMAVEASALESIRDEVKAAQDRIAEARQQIEAATRAIAEHERQIEQLHHRANAIRKRTALLEQYMELLKQEEAVSPALPATRGEPDPVAGAGTAVNGDGTTVSESRRGTALQPVKGDFVAAHGDGPSGSVSAKTGSPANGHEEAQDGFAELAEPSLEEEFGALPPAHVPAQPPEDEDAAGDQGYEVDFEALDETLLAEEILPRTQTFEQELLLLMAYHRKALRIKDVVRRFRRLDYTPKILVDKVIQTHVEGSPHFFEHVAEGRFVLTEDGRHEAERLLRESISSLK